MRDFTIGACYLLSACLLIAGLKAAVLPQSARRGLLRLTVGVAAALGGAVLSAPLAGRLWLVGALGIGAVIGLAIAAGPPHAWRVHVAAATAATGVAALMAGELSYREAIVASGYVARGSMAAMGLAILMGGVATAAALTIAVTQPASGRRNRSANNRAFVTAPLAAFALGVFAFVVIYPAASWVALTLTVVALVLGVLLAVAADTRDAAALLALGEALAGFAGSALGFAVGSAILVVGGALAGGAGAAAAVVAARGNRRTLFAVLLGLDAPDASTGRGDLPQ